MNSFKYFLLFAATIISNLAIAQAPTALFQVNPTSGCDSLTVNFLDSSSNAPTSWFWDFGNGNNSALENPSAIYTSPGTYTVSLTATNGSGSDTYTAVDLITVDPNPIVNAGSDQSVCASGNVAMSGTVIGGGGTGAWFSFGSGVFSPNDTSLVTTYIPSPADTASGSVMILLVSTNNGLCATVTDTTVISFVPSTLYLNMDSTNAICGGSCDGTASAILSGGVLPYTYVWANASTSTTITSLCAGTYSVTVSDSTGCTLVSSSIVSEPAVLNVATAVSDPNCSGSCDGIGFSLSTGGTPPYTFIWDDPALQTDSVAFGLCAGTYNVTVTDSYGCTATTPATLVNPMALSSSLTQTPAACGACDGSATVTTTGGNAPYTYLWDDPAAQTTTTAGFLCSGIYVLYTTDGSGCTASTSISVQSTSTVVFNMNLVNSSCSACDGSATPSPTNGTPPLTYLWSDSTTGTSVDSLCVGTYALQITDSMGCIADTVFNINSVGGGTASLLSSMDVSCNGNSDGSATATISGGTVPYTYLWNDAFSQTLATATGLAGGNYICTVTDSLGCVESVSVTISEPGILLVSLTPTGDDCNGSGTGSVNSTATGGTLPYTFLWSNGGITPIISALSPGPYSVTLTDANGCTTTDGTTVNAGSAIALSVIETDPYACGYYGYATYSTTGGTQPYTYQWSTQPMYTSSWSNYAYMYPGIYPLSVVGASGCSDTVEVVIANSCAPNTIKGKVFDDFNSNCVEDLGDNVLNNWVVRADPGPVFANTLSDGTYELYLDSGNYTVSLVNNEPLFRTQVCPTGLGNYNLSLGSTPGTVINTIDFSVLPASNCARMSVNFYHIGFTPCFCSWFKVIYENTGSALATNVYVEVEFPSDVLPVTSCTNGNWPNHYTQWDNQNGNVYTFNRGDVAAGTSDFFYILTETSCSAVLGATKCVIAHIYPDSSCVTDDPAWDKSSVAVNGSCVGDSACFSITNTGDLGNGDMQGASDYRIYENNILVYTGTFQLNGQDNIVICWPANSNTIRLEADQRPGHPGNSHPQDNVEMCGTPSFITGQITLMPQDDNDDFIDVVCLPVTSSWDPNDKAVAPEGLTNSHFIDSMDVLEYRIRFQNTGTDTAFNVIVRDTLSAALDLSTVKPGASSHPYRMEVHENNLLQFIFDSILLPDSNVNEPESHGFVTFKIKQKPGNTDGTLIENTVGIYFDYNAAVITNTVFNTIGDIEDLTTGVPTIYQQEYLIKVVPNPFSEYTTFQLGNADTELPESFELYNLLGKKVRTVITIENNKLILAREDLPNGVYIYKFYTGTGLIAAGKLVVN